MRERRTLPPTPYDAPTIPSVIPALHPVIPALHPVIPALHPVIPAKAGIHARPIATPGLAGVLDSGLRRNDGGGLLLRNGGLRLALEVDGLGWRWLGVWIPAFAGMTGWRRE